MAYVYRFIDINNNVSYVGYTGQQITQRINQHFTKGHLPKEAYKSIHKIEYIKFKTKADAQLYETYYINKYKPKYNKQNKRADTLTVSMNEKKWRTYMVYKKLSEGNKLNKISGLIIYWGFIAYLISIIYKYLMKLM